MIFAKAQTYLKNGYEVEESECAPKMASSCYTSLCGYCVATLIVEYTLQHRSQAMIVTCHLAGSVTTTGFAYLGAKYSTTPQIPGAELY